MIESAVIARKVDLAHVPAAGLEERVIATEAERARLSGAYDLVEVRSLDADARVSRGKAGSFTVEGRVRAEIVQTCVVSLVPVVQTIDEAFQVRFVPPHSPELSPPSQPGADVIVDPDQPDPPEPLDGPTLDVGAVVEEHFVLAIDPYPRAPGASLPEEARDSEDDAGADSPFSVLAPLKENRGRRD